MNRSIINIEVKGKQQKSEKLKQIVHEKFDMPEIDWDKNYWCINILVTLNVLVNVIIKFFVSIRQMQEIRSTRNGFRAKEREQSYLCRLDWYWCGKTQSIFSQDIANY